MEPKKKRKADSQWGRFFRFCINVYMLSRDLVLIWKCMWKEIQQSSEYYVVTTSQGRMGCVWRNPQLLLSPQRTWLAEKGVGLLLSPLKTNTHSSGELERRIAIIEIESLIPLGSTFVCSYAFVSWYCCPLVVVVGHLLVPFSYPKLVSQHLFGVAFDTS